MRLKSSRLAEPAVKTLTGYTYLNSYCKNHYPKWIVFQDDDTFVDNPKLLNFLKSKSSESAQFYCPQRARSVVQRPGADQSVNVKTGLVVNTNHKPWKPGQEMFVNETLWDLDYYPVYCAGPCTIMSAPTAAAIYSSAVKTNWRGFPIEDAFFTGIIRQKANLPQPPCCFDHRSYCTHYNKDSKYDDLKARVDRYLHKP